MAICRAVTARCRLSASCGSDVARPKNKTKLQRRKPQREPYERVLIVCEGSKTEPNYLRELVAACQLSSANVQITGEGGSAPKSVAELAISLFESDPDYDAVFCVFDRDGHATFNDAIQRIRDKKLIRRTGQRKVGEARFEAVVSVPCFEYWILLHYVDTTAPMPRYVDLLHHLHRVPGFADYDKGARGLFAKTQALMETALARADRANAAAKRVGTDNPSTQMAGLVRYLLELARKTAR